MAKLLVVETSLDRAQKAAVEQLSQVLQEAREGDVAGVAIAIVRPGGTVDTAWTNCYSVAALMGSVALLGAELSAAAIRDTGGAR
jgi:hypothetical protein